MDIAYPTYGILNQNTAPKLVCVRFANITPTFCPFIVVSTNVKQIAFLKYLLLISNIFNVKAIFMQWYISKVKFVYIQYLANICTLSVIAMKYQYWPNIDHISYIIHICYFFTLKYKFKSSNFKKKRKNNVLSFIRIKLCFNKIQCSRERRCCIEVFTNVVLFYR